MPINATFHGFIETTTDSLLLFEACRRGVLPKISRRLQERERGSVKSGTVFVFDEKESGIKRWTDGLIWSPSRILGNFLIYRELGGRESINDKSSYQQYEYNQYAPYDQYSSNNPYNMSQQQQHLLCQENIQESLEEDDYDENMTIEERNRDRNLVGSLTDTYKFRKGGLIKKTLSIQLDGCTQHLISYYTKEDVLKCRLATPSSISEISCLQISPDLLLKQSFRVPPSVEFAELMLKRPSLSPSSTTSSSTSSSSINTVNPNSFHQHKRLPATSIKNMNFHHHPYSPLLHQSQQYNQDEDDDHSLYHSRKLIFEPSSIKSNKLSRTSLDSTNSTSRCSSASYRNYPLDSNNSNLTPSSSSYGISSIMAASDASGSNDIYSSRYHGDGRSISEVVNNTQSGFSRAVPILTKKNNGSPISSVDVYSSSNTTSFYDQDTRTPQPSATDNTNHNKSAFMAPINDSHKEMDQQQEQPRRHSHAVSPVSISSSSPPSRAHRHNSYPSAPPPISSNYQQRSHDLVPTISVLSSSPSSYHYQQQQGQTRSLPLLSPSRFLWSNDTYQGQQGSRQPLGDSHSAATAKPENFTSSNIPTSPLYPSPPISNTTRKPNNIKQQHGMTLPYNNAELSFTSGNNDYSRYYENNNRSTTETAASSSAFINVTAAGDQFHQTLHYQQQNYRYDSNIYNNNHNDNAIMNSSANNITTATRY